MYSLTAQLPKEQEFCSSLSPVQSNPPCWGAGLLHDLSLVLNPIPHDKEQLDHKPQSDQLPSTTTIHPTYSDIHFSFEIPNNIIS